MHFISIAIICSALVLIATASDPSHGKTVMCVKYINSPTLLDDFTHNGINRSLIADSDLNSCTHLICADTFMQSTNDFEWTREKEEQLEECVNSRTSYPHLKILYRVKHTPSEYSEIANDSLKHREFNKWTFGIVSRYNFDGLNLDWQHSTERSALTTHSLMNKKAPVTLLKELNEVFKSKDLLLIATFSVKLIVKNPLYDQSKAVISTPKFERDFHLLNMYDFALISKYVDYLVIESNVDDEFNMLMEMGVSSRKIIMKLPLSQMVSFDHENKMEQSIIVNTMAKYLKNVIRKYGLAGVFVEILFKNPINTESQLEIITKTLDPTMNSMDNLIKLISLPIKAVVMLAIEVNEPKKTSLNAYNQAINKMTEKYDVCPESEVNSAMENIKFGFNMYQNGVKLYAKLFGNSIDYAKSKQNWSSALFKSLFGDETESQAKTNKIDNINPIFKADLDLEVKNYKFIFEAAQLYVKLFSTTGVYGYHKEKLNAYSKAINIILKRLDTCSEEEVKLAEGNIKSGLIMFKTGLRMFSNLMGTNDDTNISRSLSFSTSFSKAIDTLIEY